MVVRVALKAVGIEPGAKSRHYPPDLKERATEALLPLDPYFEDDPTVKEWLLEHRPTLAGSIDYLVSLFPFARWIGNYNRQWLVGDIIGGITLGFVVVPQAMAYSILAGLRPEFGLYTSFAGSCLYWVFGTSKDLSVGATAVVSLLVSRIVDAARVEHPEFAPEEVSKTIAALSGFFLLAFGLLRLDWLIELIPHVAIAAFVTGASITIAISQLPTVLGIHATINTREAPYLVFVNTCRALPKATVGAAVGLTAILILHLIKSTCAHLAVKQKHRARMWDTISSLRMTFVILLYTLISFIVNRGLSPEDAKFKILGSVPSGFQAAGAPSLDVNLIKTVAPQLPALLMILIIEHVAIGKSFGRLNNYTIVPSQEIISIGMANLLGPFVGGYPATASFTGTALLSNAGVRTPLAGLFNTLILILSLYALTSVFYFIPSAALGGLIFHAVCNLVTRPATVYKYWQVAPLDVFVFFLGVLLSVFQSLEIGIYATVGLSFLILLLRIAKSQGSFLGRARVQSYPPQPMAALTNYNNGSRHGSHSSGDDWTLGRPGAFDPSDLASSGRDEFLPLDRRDGSNAAIEVASVYPGVFVYRFTEGCNYINQAQCVDHMVAHITSHARRKNVDEYQRPGDRPWNEPNPKEKAKAAESLNEITLPLLRAVICDFGSVNHVDTTAVEGLMDMRAQLDRFAAPASVEWHFAGVRSRWTRRALAAAGFGYPSAVTSGGFWMLAFDVGTTVPHDPAPSPVAKQHADEPADCEMGLGAAGSGSGSGTVTPKSSTGEQTDAGRRYAPIFGVDRPFLHVSLASAVSNAVESARLRDQLGGDTTDE